jgi:hypothetical protein
VEAEGWSSDLVVDCDVRQLRQLQLESVTEEEEQMVR